MKSMTRLIFGSEKGRAPVPQKVPCQFCGTPAWTDTGDVSICDGCRTKPRPADR